MTHPGLTDRKAPSPTAAASTITPLSSGLPKTGNRRPTVVIARGVPGNNVTTGSATDSLTGRCALIPACIPSEIASR